MGIAGAGKYVANYGESTVSKIEGMKVTGTIQVGDRPYAIAQSKLSDPRPVWHVFITNSKANTVSVYDESAQKVVATIPVGKTPQGVAATNTGKIYVANAGDNTVSVINQRTLTVTKTIRKDIGNFPTAVATRWEPSARRNYVFVTNTGADTVSVIDAASDEVINTHMLFLKYPIGAASGLVPRCFVTNQKGNSVTEIDTVTQKVLTSVKVGRSPVAVGIKYPAVSAVGYSGRFDVFVANGDDGTVTILKRDWTSNFEETQVLQVGKGPSGVDASGTDVAVTNFLENTVTFIRGE